MLRFDVALEALKRKMVIKADEARAGDTPGEAAAAGILMPFPLRKISLRQVHSLAAKRRAPG